MSSLTAEQWGDEYRIVLPQHELFMGELRNLLEQLVRAEGIEFAQIDCRTKTVESLVEKIKRKKDKYANPLLEVTDLVGLRVISYYAEDVPKIGTLLRREFAVDEANSRDAAANRAVDQFGYSSVHYIVSVEPRRAQLVEWRRFDGLKAEIQVRTVMQHAWAAVNHKLTYKSEQELPRELHRDLSRLSALLELADKEFSDLRRGAAEIRSDYEEHLERDLELPIDATSVALYLEREGTAEHWRDLAIAAGFRDDRDDPTRDEEAERRDIADLVGVLNQIKVTSLSELDGLLMEVGDRGPELLEAIVAESGERDYTPQAVPYDVIAMIALLARPPETFEGETPFRKELEAVIETVARSR